MKKNNHTPTDKQQLKEDMKQLAIARLKSIPSQYQISVGGGGGLTRKEAVENIENDSEIGKELVNIQIEFLRDMAQGELYKYE